MMGPETFLVAADNPAKSLFLLYKRPSPQHLGQPQPLRLPSVKDRFHNVGRQASEREQPADIRVRHALLLRKVGDRGGHLLSSGVVCQGVVEHRRGAGFCP